MSQPSKSTARSQKPARKANSNRPLSKGGHAIATGARDGAANHGRHSMPPGKQEWRAGTMLAPVPAVMVSCGGTHDFAANIITLAWAGTVCSDPPMLSVSIRSERHSHAIISMTREFVVNLTTARLARATDWCGVKSGRDVDKFAATGLTPLKSVKVGCPGIAESPVNLECKVKKILPLGSHDLFIAEIVAVQVSEEFLDKRGKLHLDKAGLMAFAHGEYYALGERLGFFGFSVKKRS